MILTRGVRFADVDHPTTHAHVSGALAATLDRLGFTTYDRGLMLSPDRRVTRPVATYLHRYARQHGEARISGLRYESRLYREWECWALWRPFPFTAAVVHTIVTFGNRDLRAAAERLGVRLPSARVQ